MQSMSLVFVLDILFAEVAVRTNVKNYIFHQETFYNKTLL